MGKPKGRARKKKFGKRGPDGRAVSQKPKLALQHELPPGSGDALSDGDDGAELMDVDAEEEKAAADEDVNDEDWCEEDPSGAHSSGGAGLARTMGAWMQRARREKEQEDEEESSSVGGEVGPVENPAVDLEVAPHAGPPGRGSVCADSGHLEASSSCSSVGDMSIASGHGLLIEEFCSGQEMRDAEEVLEDNCDTLSDGRGNKAMMPEEVCKKSNLVAAQYSMNKNYRVAKRKAPASEQKSWTKTQLDRARGRARKHWTRRKAELMQTYRDAYDKLQKVRIQEGVAKMDHSRAAAEVAKVESKAVRRWVKEFCKGGAFVVPKRQYNKREPHSFIEDEDKRNHLRGYIDRKLYRRKKDEPRLRIADVQKWINEELLKDELAGTKGVSRRTVHKWMQKLGFRWSRHHKCVYVDGHNRPDIVNDRRGFVAYLLGPRK
ncbi:unnamed protein product [Ectocarpus sp. CCAP 1310/34]|nr:unnamed protein product [Ectocarpus sp. CCAP 1310/34]